MLRATGRRRRFGGAALGALALALACSAPATPALAQAAQAVLPGGIGKTVPEGTPLLLEADRLTYNRDADTITASGGVQIAYGTYRLVASEVSYDQASGRLTARGAVEIVEPDGNRVYADEVDVTDDFGRGFVNALRVETAANTRFAAESAVRGQDGTRTVFNNGVYTACETCAEDPDKPLTWRIRARTVIWNQRERTITFDRSSFELFGQPLFDVPRFSIPDHTVERRSGFLFPRARASEKLGLGVTVPYYFALNPSFDATVQATLFTRQGLLAEGQFRRRFASGDLELRAAGIAQLDPDAFEPGTTDDTVGRAMIGGRGDFRLGENWQWGFDFLAQTDGTFAATYDIAGYDAGTFVNNVYLIGLDDRAYLEIKAEDFIVQSNDRDYVDENPVVYPSLDYEKTLDRTFAGGEVSFDIAAVNLTRENQTCRTSIVDPAATLGSREIDDCTYDPRDGTALRIDPVTGQRVRVPIAPGDPDRLPTRVTGIDGNYTRIGGELAWERTLTTDAGLVLEPLLAGRLDGVAIDTDEPAVPGRVGIGTLGPRTMVTAGLEARYPVAAYTAGGTHVFEPIAQLFVRPSEGVDGAIVNEDSQSLVFDSTTLFERDKFSGDDRIEGGTRANVGLRYAGDLSGGIGIDAVIGQSFHIAGENPYGLPSQRLDLVNVGAQSGLETDRSDIVAGVSVATLRGFEAAGRVRLDEGDLGVERFEAEASYAGIDFSAVAKYAFIGSQPDAGTIAPRHQVHGAGRVRVGEHWTVAANATYDIEADALWRRGAGVTYADECFVIGLDYTENRRNLDAIERSLQLNVSLRTVGDFGVSRFLAANN